MKVSFDYDSTIDINTVETYAKSLVDGGIEVWIVTARLSDEEAPSIMWNHDLWKTTKRVGILKGHVKFMAYSDKSEFFKENDDFVFHVDDDALEGVMFEYEKLKTKFVLRGYHNDWRTECDNAIEEYIYNS